MLDLSAAFDTLDHDIMLNRFQHRFGINGIVLQWYSSYFRDRTNHVSISGSNSGDIVLDYGVPQGSVIGPCSFTMYIVPIGDILREHDINFHIYADDIQIYMDFDPAIPGDAECCLFNFRLSACVKDVQTWPFANKLMLNKEKKEFYVT